MVLSDYPDHRTSRPVQVLPETDRLMSPVFLAYTKTALVPRSAASIILSKTSHHRTRKLLREKESRSYAKNAISGQMSY